MRIPVSRNVRKLAQNIYLLQIICISPWISGPPYRESQANTEKKGILSLARPADGFLGLRRLGLVLEPLIKGTIGGPLEVIIAFIPHSIIKMAH